MDTLSFTGHETFHCRELWLKKGYDFAKNGGNFASPMAVAELGVGKNMVRAIQHWLRAFGVLDQKGQLSKFANVVLDDDGYDPYLEHPATLWMLHWHLVTGGVASLYWIMFNEYRRERVEFMKHDVLNFVQRKCEANDKSITLSTIESDFGVFVRNYVAATKKGKSGSDDDISGLLVELNLLRPVFREGMKGAALYKLESANGENVPWQVVLYAILLQFPGLSISFNDLLIRENSPGTVFLLTGNGLYHKIEEIVQAFPSRIIFSDDAGIRELQFKSRITTEEVWRKIYEA